MADLIPWPFPLPERFLEVLGYARAVSGRFPVTDQLRAQIRRDFGDDGLAAFEASLANRGPRRFVALFWEPAGDELGWTDGQSSGAGQLDHWLWLDYLHRRGQFAGPIHGWLVEYQVDLGSSDCPATHALVIDRNTDAAYVAPIALARRIVREQSLNSER